MARLIDNLLSLNRIETRLHLRPQAIVDLQEIAAHVVATLEPAAEKSGIACHFSVGTMGRCRCKATATSWCR